MSRNTTLFLLVIALGLGAAIFWQLRQESRGEHIVDVRLFEGVDPARVQTIRIDNIERSTVMRLERDSRGVWYITDPIVYPADAGRVDSLMADVATGRAMPMPEHQWSAEELGFAPPKIVLEVDELTEDGLRTHSVEIGAPDLDRVRVHVRMDGVYYRALRRLYTNLNYSLEEFRSVRAMGIRGDDVVEVHRTGKVLHEIDGEEQDTDFHAYRERTIWRSMGMTEALLDPMDVGVVVFGAAGLKIDRFVEDAPSDLSRYALDDPLVRIELKLGNGAREVLLLSRIGNRPPWFAKLESAPHVFRVEEQSALRLLYPFEAMLDTRFCRVRRGDVDALILTDANRELRLERRESGWVAMDRSDGGAWSQPTAADGHRVEVALAQLEALEVQRFELNTTFPRESARLAVRIEVGGEALGGRLGPLTADVDGIEGRLFQRDKDEVTAIIDPWLAELAESPLADFRSTELLSLVETELRGLRLLRAGRALEYERDGRGIWRAAGESMEAVELLALLDPLLFLRAAEHLAGPGTADAQEPGPSPPISVSFSHDDGREVTFAVHLGKDEGGDTRSEIWFGAARSVARVDDLYQRLSELF